MKKDEKITLWSERIHEFQSSGQTCKTWCQEPMWSGTVNTIVAALVNIGLNFILIPIFQQNAAAFTTVIAELLSMIITWWNGRKYFKVSFLKKDICSVAIGCVAIWIVCSMTEKYISSVLISTVFSVIASAAYMIILLIMKNQAVKLVLEILHIKK